MRRMFFFMKRMFSFPKRWKKRSFASFPILQGNSTYYNDSNTKNNSSFLFFFLKNTLQNLLFLKKMFFLFNFCYLCWLVLSFYVFFLNVIIDKFIFVVIFVRKTFFFKNFIYPFLFFVGFLFFQKRKRCVSLFFSTKKKNKILKMFKNFLIFVFQHNFPIY